jgi:hypothetical protein
VIVRDLCFLRQNKFCYVKNNLYVCRIKLITNTSTKMLEDLKKLAIEAHEGTSFDPERRGEHLIIECEANLRLDLLEIEDATAEQKEAYTKKFRSLLTAWLHSKSRCISTMITGPANFPVRRAMKFNDWEQKKYQVFKDWRTRAKKAIIKSTFPESNPLEELRRDLLDRVKTQEFYKTVNAAYRAYNKNSHNLDKFNLQNETKQMIISWTPKYSYETAPIEGWKMTNNLANIKRIEKRILELEKKEEVKSNCQQEFYFDQGAVILNFSIDRVQIKHDKKPDKAVIDLLKHAGFHWSPSNMVWQRQMTDEAKRRAQQITGVQIF